MLFIDELDKNNEQDAGEYALAHQPAFRWR